MTSLASLPVVASATPAAVGAAPAQARSGEDFGAALARSRSSGGRASDKSDKSDKSEETSAAQLPRRKSIAAAADKEHSPAELLAFALLTPAFLATSPRAAPLDAPGSAAAASVAAQETAAPLPQDPLAAAGVNPSGDDASNAQKDEVQAARVDETARKLPGAAGRAEAGKPEAPASRSMEAATAAAPAALPAATASTTTPVPLPGKAVGDIDKAAATPSPTAVVQQAADAAASQPAEHEDISLASASTPSTSAPAPALTALPPTTTTVGPTAPAPAAPAHVPVRAVEPPVGSEAWGTAIGQQMIRMTASGEHVAELNLNPAGLGPLKVSLTLGDNQAQAMFVSAHESVRKAIEAALPQLRSQLADQGISLGQASVDAGTQQQHGAGRDAAFDAPAPRSSSAAPQRAAAPEALAATRVQTARSQVGGVDTFA